MTVSKKSKYKRFLFCCLRSNLLLFQFWESRHLLDAFPNDYESSKSHSLLKDFWFFLFTCKKKILFICLKVMVLQLITANRNAPFMDCSKQSFSFWRIHWTIALQIPPAGAASTSLSCACSFLCLTPKALLLHQLKENAGAAKQNRQLTTAANKYYRHWEKNPDLSYLIRPRHYSRVEVSMTSIKSPKKEHVTKSWASVRRGCRISPHFFVVFPDRY